jgi:hypothetical protein
MTYVLLLFNPYINITSQNSLQLNFCYYSLQIFVFICNLYNSPPCGSTPVLPGYLLLWHSCIWDKTSTLWSCQIETNKNTIYSSFKNIIWKGLMNSFQITSSYTINNNQSLFCLIISQYSYNLLVIIDRVILMKSWKQIINSMSFLWFLPRIVEWWLECRPLSNLGCSWKASPS